MLKITTPITPTHVRAVERAAEMLRAGHAPRLLARGLYEVPSGTFADVAYRVEVRNVSTLAATCTCPAGGVGKFCKHQALAICAETRRVSPKRPARTAAEVAAAVAKMFPR